MRDQASQLRRLSAARGLPACTPPTRTGVFVVGSGKGGVGKSVLSVLLAASMAKEGHRVLLFDGSQNQGNLHILLGVRPTARLDELFAGQIAPEDLLLTIRDSLWLLPMDSGAESVYALPPTDRARLHLRMTTLFDAFDFVVIDAGSGFESAVRATMGATRLLAVAVPEPASLSDVYALIKLVTLQVPFLPIDLLINRAASEEEAMAIHQRLGIATDRFLNRDLPCLGMVGEIEELSQIVRSPGRILDFENREISVLARRLLEQSVTSNAHAQEKLNADH